MELWAVGKVTVSVYNSDSECIGICWTFEGVYTSEEQAIGACFSENHFIGPVTLGAPLVDAEEWPGCYYPLSSDNRQLN